MRRESQNWWRQALADLEAAKTNENFQGVPFPQRMASIYKL